MDANYCPEIKCRWTTYGTYRFVLWAWMMNEASIVFASAAIAHSAFYVHGIIHLATVLLVAVPLVYSEICIAQYTNCDLSTMWNFFPILRGVGYGTVYLIVLKTLYMLVLCTWYLEYTFYSALDPPPWFTCNDYNTSKCMVKWINVSVFQHCLETQNMFNDDCEMKTASYCFYEREIGGNNTLRTTFCFLPWKAMIAGASISFALFVLSIKKEKLIQVAVKFVVAYVSIVIFVLCCVALSTSGSWFSSNVVMNWANYSFHACFTTATRGFLSVATGSGIIVFLSRDTSFRSHATMTAVAIPMLSVFVSLMFALIAFSGIRTMSYFHGEEENVIELGDGVLFREFASISEILSYFDAMPVWGFAWFSAIFWCMFQNLWILFLFLRELLVNNIQFSNTYNKTFCFLLSIFLFVFSCPFFCSDLFGSLLDATEIIQLTNCFIFSLSLYWIYGLKNHSVDIIFMIGVKSSYFWKVAWILNPVILLIILYTKWVNFGFKNFEDSFIIKAYSQRFDIVVFYVLVIIYFLIVIVGMLFQVITYYRFDNIRNLFIPTRNWGPKDKTLYKSRLMFVPQIMTTEFLYRQVRIHGYRTKNKKVEKKQIEKYSEESLTEKMEWSALTSN